MQDVPRRTAMLLSLKEITGESLSECRTGCPPASPSYETEAHRRGIAARRIARPALIFLWSCT